MTKDLFCNKTVSINTENDLRNRIVNRWGVIGGVSGAAICFGATFLGIEPLADIIKLPELVSPVMRFSISVVPGILGGMMGGAFGIEPLGKWRANEVYPVPKQYHPLPTYEEFAGTSLTE